MRISVNDSDGNMLVPHLLIFLNDQYIEYIIEADEEKGQVVFYSRHGDGRIVREGTSLKKETRTGKVEIVLRPNTPADIVKLYCFLRSSERQQVVI